MGYGWGKWHMAGFPWEKIAGRTLETTGIALDGIAICGWSMLVDLIPRTEPCQSSKVADQDRAQICEQEMELSIVMGVPQVRSLSHLSMDENWGCTHDLGNFKSMGRRTFFVMLLWGWIETSCTILIRINPHYGG
jgi:hypothetical protein